MCTNVPKRTGLIKSEWLWMCPLDIRADGSFNEMIPEGSTWIAPEPKKIKANSLEYIGRLSISCFIPKAAQNIQKSIHYIPLHFTIPFPDSIQSISPGMGFPAVCFSTLSWQDRWQGRASCSKICQLLADPIFGGEKIWLVVLPSGKLI